MGRLSAFFACSPHLQGNHPIRLRESEREGEVKPAEEARRRAADVARAVVAAVRKLRQLAQQRVPIRACVFKAQGPVSRL